MCISIIKKRVFRYISAIKKILGYLEMCLFVFAHSGSNSVSVLMTQWEVLGNLNSFLFNSRLTGLRQSSSLTYYSRLAA